MPDRQDPAKQVNARLLAPAVVLALARDRATSFLGVPDERGADPERADEKRSALAHTTRVGFRQRGVHRARGHGCSCSRKAVEELCVVIDGSWQLKLDDTLSDGGPSDVFRVAPEVARGF